MSIESIFPIEKSQFQLFVLGIILFGFLALFTLVYPQVTAYSLGSFIVLFLIGYGIIKSSLTAGEIFKVLFWVYFFLFFITGLMAFVIKGDPTFLFEMPINFFITLISFLLVYEIALFVLRLVVKKQEKFKGIVNTLPLPYLAIPTLFILLWVIFAYGYKNSFGVFPNLIMQLLATFLITIVIYSLYYFIAMRQSYFSSKK